MTNNEIRAIVQDIESGEVAQLSSFMDKFRKAGFVRGEGVGNKNMTPPEIVRWYVGQGLHIEELGALFAMKSWLNCVDRFVPADEEAQKSVPGAGEDAKKTVKRSALKRNHWYSVEEDGWFPVEVVMSDGIFGVMRPFPYKLGQSFLLVATADSIDNDACIRTVNANFTRTGLEMFKEHSRAYYLVTEGPRTYRSDGAYTLSPDFVPDPVAVEKATEVYKKIQRRYYAASRRASGWRLTSFFDYSEQTDVRIEDVLMWMIVDSPKFAFPKKELEEAQYRAEHWDELGLPDTAREYIRGTYTTEAGTGVIKLVV